MNMAYENVYALYGTSDMPLRSKLIINVCLTGNVPQKSHNPNIPITPDEIASDAHKCFQEGATVFHVHPRDADGTPACKKELFAEIIAKIRQKCPGAVISATTSGRLFRTFEERSTPLTLEGDLKPDFGSLTLGSMNFPTNESVNSPAMIEKLATAMIAKGIRPELEIFETGMINYAAFLLKRNVLRAPLYFNLFLGILGTMPARMVDLCHLVNSLPDGSIWGAAGGGKFQLPINTAAMLMGGHVRVGLEDNIYYDTEKTVPATNPMLVKRIVRLAGELSRPIAKPAETREILGLNAAARITWEHAK